MVAIRSYEQYRQWIRSALTALPGRQVCRFTLWCLSRMHAEFGAAARVGLTDTEREALQVILEVLEAGAREETAMPAERAAELAGVIENFGPREEDEGLEAETIETLGAVWHALQYARTGDAVHACAVSEALINLRDHQAGDAYEGYRLENMFIFPELRREIELQEKFIESLS